MRPALLTVLLLTLPLPGQEKATKLWGDLKFGMTVAEARKALSYRSNAPKKREQVPGKSVPGVRRLEVPKGALGAMPVTGALYFGEGDSGLTGVLLISNHESPNYCGMPGNLEKQSATLLWQSFLSELEKQNGAPSSTRSAEGEGGVTSQVATWSGATGAPDVTLLLMGSCKRIDATVTYAPAGFRKP